MWGTRSLWSYGVSLKKCCLDNDACDSGSGQPRARRNVVSEVTTAGRGHHVQSRTRIAWRGSVTALKQELADPQRPGFVTLEVDSFQS